ncbi:hypothetical protein J4209_04515 [Candidatus Woesearchaeota archaeon]|nr:hypothetical protein [Candidatus Woesearchaeota archaeon]
MAKEKSDEEEKEEKTIYDSDGREDLVEDDELTPQEEGFMQGYDTEEEKEEKGKEEEEEEEEKGE